MRLHSHGANYVGSVQWAAVLDSISELKDHYEMEEEARMLAPSDHTPPLDSESPGPRLFYQAVQATKADILESMPARAIVDRMVSRYFNAQGAAPAILHSSQFPREYESFWREPTSASYAWIGPLFSIMCLSAQFQLLNDIPTQPDTLKSVYIFRDRTVQCLILCRYTRGGPYVLETMINYCNSEFILCKDADITLWLLQGVLVRLALSLGYHRDPRNFPNLSSFASEMQRRVWSVIVQMDLRLSGQMGLPRLLKSHQYDTAEPRNLLDEDFDEATVELPPSRPETEVTPVLYGLAKNRIDSISGLIGDLVADTRAHQHPYPEIMELDGKLQEVQGSLPPIFRWQPLSRSFMVPPQIVLHRIWLQLAVHRLTIWLHRKYLAPSLAQESYANSRNACVQAAMKILEFQQLVDEESEPDGQLYVVRWMRSSLLQSIFLLGMSVLCYYLQLAKSTPDVSLDPETSAKIHALLRSTYPLWLRSSTVSRDARQAVEYLSLLLGLRDREEGISVARQDDDPLATSQDDGMSLDQVTWGAYQAFGADFMALDTPGPSSALSVSSVTNPLLMGNAAELDGWMAVQSEGALPREA